MWNPVEWPIHHLLLYCYYLMKMNCRMVRSHWPSCRQVYIINWVRPSTEDVRTCVMSTVHSSVMVTHSIQIIQELRRSQVGSTGLLPPRLEWGLVGAVVAAHHVRRHVQTRQGEVHERGEFVPPLSHLPEALQVEDEDVRQRPQAHLHHALLQLLTMRALPGIVRCKLEEDGVGRTWP